MNKRLEDALRSYERDVARLRALGYTARVYHYNAYAVTVQYYTRSGTGATLAHGYTDNAPVRFEYYGIHNRRVERIVAHMVQELVNAILSEFITELIENIEEVGKHA